MALTGVNSGTNTYAASKDVVENPKGKLDNQAFMKLFLTELKYQDPTSPMDSDKMLTQTSQLTQLETNQALKTSLEQVTKQLQQSSAITSKYSSLGLVGKVVQTGANTYELNNNTKDTSFSLYFPSEIKLGSVKIYNEQNTLVKTIPLNDKVGKSGYVDFVWNNKNESGETVKSGKYKIVADYTDKNGATNSTTLGSGKVDGVLFDKGDVFIRLGNSYVPVDKVKEVM